jgi:hypothetical protein
MRMPSPATVIAMVALFVALGGVGVAAAGGNFILGRANTSDKQTSLTGAAPNPELRVENTSTDGNARGVVGLISSASAAAGSAGVAGMTASTDPGSVGVFAQNTGGGPALSAAVNPGSAPLAVNSSVKVTNLNADQLDGFSANEFLSITGKAADSNRLDGKDSTQFVQGGGSIAPIRATTSTFSSGLTQTILGTFAGPSGAPFLKVQANCADHYSPTSGELDGASIYLTNVTSGNILRWIDLGSGDPRVDLLVPTEIDAVMPFKVAAHTVWHGRFGTNPTQTFELDAWSYKDPSLTCTYDLRLTLDP